MRVRCCSVGLVVWLAALGGEDCAHPAAQTAAAVSTAAGALGGIGGLGCCDVDVEGRREAVVGLQRLLRRREALLGR